ncbi:hypothetical protein [Modestobacter sp. Leaf380]|uniref:hypothetical protein n=1 Tax=Modestobacter sp. Leaf380 TaxID=1736356 RepID=UPI000701CDE6|nr:hypothetical protein [Modestobacter sp. Leaf380]KQS73740.1 hypothetical protein ASG41_03880 [Modestobacter sp. Leaf380]
MTRSRVGPVLAALAAGAVLLTGCGGGDDPAAPAATGPAPAATPSSAAQTGGDSAGALAVPAEYGLPELTVPADARVVDYETGGGLAFEVLQVDQTEVLDALQQQLEAAGFQVVRSEGDADLALSSLQASKEGAGRVQVTSSSADALTVLVDPPA